MGVQICLKKSSPEWLMLIFRWRSMASDLIQFRRNQVPPAERPSSSIFSKVGRDPALEELVDVQIPDSDPVTSPAAELPALFQV